jgi:hypothetical protein
VDRQTLALLDPRQLLRQPKRLKYFLTNAHNRQE